MDAQQLFREFCLKKSIDPATPYAAWAFCGGGSIGDFLADLVLQRKKFATASAYDAYVAENALDELPKPGDYSVILKDNGEALCVIRDYDVCIRPFIHVPSFHAYAEGEGDRSLAYWRRVHTEVLSQDLKEDGLSFTLDSPVVCENFSVEYVPGEDASDADELIFAEPSMTFADEIQAYRRELLDAQSSFDGCFSLKRDDIIQSYVERCAGFADPERIMSPIGARGQVVLCVRKSDMKLIGCFQAHYVLSRSMSRYTGHVGYSVRPSERKKGYATKMLRKAKDFLSSFGFDDFVVSCLPDNIGSRKVIMNNGGRYIGSVYLEQEGVLLDRFRIEL